MDGGGGGGSGSNGGGGGQGGGQWFLLCSACVRVGTLTHRLALRARGPGHQGGCSGACFAWLWQRKAAEFFERHRQDGIDGNVRILAAAHPWTSVAAAVAAAAGGGAAALALLCLRWGPFFRNLLRTTLVSIFFKWPFGLPTSSIPQHNLIFSTPIHPLNNCIRFINAFNIRT
jgi:hypothetical protein